jgi:hypothetical protein
LTEAGHLQLFKVHLPYHESDHVLSLAYNALCGGTCLEDLELRRQDEAYLNLLGAAEFSLETAETAAAVHGEDPAPREAAACERRNRQAATV